MCAKLLACPLCSQPAFVTLDALRTGLISVATRPLACPVCNEVLLGVDKLTIHLFSHAINLSSDGKANGNQTDVNFYSEGKEHTKNENNASVSQSWSSIDRQNMSVKKFLTRDESGKHKSQIITSKVAIPALRRVAGIQSSCYTNSTISTSSQTCSEDRLQSRESAASSIATTNQVIFLQNSQQIKQASSFLGDDVYLKNLMEEKEKKLESSRGGDEVKQLCLNGVENLLTQSSENPVIESYGKSIIQFKPIWSENSSQEICVQSILIDGNDSGAGQMLTISQKPAIRNDKVCLKGASDVESEKNSEIEVMKSSVNEPEPPNQRQVLPQLKAFKALATKEKTERCDVCGFYFSDPNILILHKQLVHMINENDLNRKPEDLLKNYPCHLCPKIFKMKGSLMVHMRVAHIGYNLGSLPKEGEPVPIPGEQGYNCPTCGKNFKKEQHVTQHLKTHEGKQWECDVCSKMFTTKYFLKKHKRLHSGEMPYKCNICEKTFTFQQSYHKHRLYHKDDKPHACATCGRSFKELSTLHNHERIHTGEKPFACETCGKCFRQRVSYLVHRRIHTGAMPYKCTACGKSFRYKVSQRTHKCTAQPPGTVVRQSSDLVQRLLQVSQIKDASMRDSSETELAQREAQINCIPNEENRYILIVNNQGQHVLTRQSEIDSRTASNETEAERSLNLNKCEEEKNDERRFIEDLWGHDIPNGTTLKDSIEMSVKNGLIESPEQKSQPVDRSNDFFSMVLSPTENAIQSPSSEMEHLRLSSPTNSENLLDNMKNNSEQSGNNFQCEISECGEMIRQNFREDGNQAAAAQTLPTINEESLKQLLYGTTEIGQR